MKHRLNTQDVCEMSQISCFVMDIFVLFDTENDLNERVNHFYDDLYIHI